YLQAVRSRLTLQHVFYGALDLHRDGRAPIHDLQAHVRLLDWIDAARAFDRYGDPGPVATLLQDDHRADRFSEFSRNVQLNALRDLRDDARKITAAYAGSDDGAPIPFSLLLPRLLDLPRRLVSAGHSWEAK